MSKEEPLTKKQLIKTLQGFGLVKKDELFELISKLILRVSALEREVMKLKEEQRIMLEEEFYEEDADSGVINDEFWDLHIKKLSTKKEDLN